MKTLSETGETSIDRACVLPCTVEKDVNTLTNPPWALCVPCHCPLPGQSWIFLSVTLCSCLKCFYPLHKQVNNILGISSAFYKEWNSWRRGRRPVLSSSPPGFFSRDPSQLTLHPALKPKNKMQLSADLHKLKCSVISANGHARQLLWMQRGPERNRIFKIILLWLLF